MDSAEAQRIAAACEDEYPPTNPRVLTAAVAVLTAAGEQVSAQIVFEWAQNVGHGKDSAGSPRAAQTG